MRKEYKLTLNGELIGILTNTDGVKLADIIDEKALRAFCLFTLGAIYNDPQELRDDIENFFDDEEDSDPTGFYRMDDTGEILLSYIPDKGLVQ
jgi:hypothetical protein